MKNTWEIRKKQIVFLLASSQYYIHNYNKLEAQVSLYRSPDINKSS
jgi:hypothetical protein